MTSPSNGHPTRPNQRLDRAIDALAESNDRWHRVKSAFPGLVKVFLIIGLAFLSWVSTYTGMVELVKANVGQIDLIYKIAMGFAVAMLMLMIIYILDTLFAPISWWLRTLYIGGYIFLTLISVGFGFGFYWKFLESRSEATRSAEAAVTQVQAALQKSQTRLETLQQTLASLTSISRKKAIDERAKGNTCPNSRPGDGPRRRLRDRDAKDFEFVGQFVGRKMTEVRADMSALGKDLAKITGRTPGAVDAVTGTRNAFLRELNRKLDLTITRFNAFRTDPQLRQFRDRFAARADKTVFPDGRGGTFSCPDPQLQSTLRGVVRAIDGLPLVKKTDIAAVEGSEAIVEAFRRLITTTMGAVQFKLPPSPDDLRTLQRKAIQSAQDPGKQQVVTAAKIEPGLGQRDYIPLFIALFVDFCILLVSINRPINRFQVLLSVIREARDGPIGQILTQFHDTHLGGLRREFEIFQHVVFDFLGDYYVAVPVSSKRLDARYLSNLLVSLEGKGIVDRVMLPPHFIVRRKLSKLGSDFASAKMFRLYRFREGAWSKLVLDAVLGIGPSEMPSAAAAGNGHAGNGHDMPPPGTGPETSPPPPTVYNKPEEAAIALPPYPGPRGNGRGRDKTEDA